LFEQGYHELQHDEERGELLEKAIQFYSTLPKYVIKPFGKCVVAKILPSPSNHLKKILILVAIALLGFIIRYLKNRRSNALLNVTNS
jgi:hypothetical protein